MRVSCRWEESPRQYAPARLVSFTALIGFEFCRCCTRPFERTSTACSASFGPIARAASRPVAPSGSSSWELSGRTTFMVEEKDKHPREDDRNDEIDESPVPDPEAKDTSAKDDPEAD